MAFFYMDFYLPNHDGMKRNPLSVVLYYSFNLKININVLLKISDSVPLVSLY